ncbi:hypothetical protein [Litoribacter populi]|uniref:hypothetical protein n=1 Tax=Litoribacter populi TaxID=2598460 RepID=UPI00117D2043|nr:hypothetical protein [Litoribacter populi]
MISPQSGVLAQGVSVKSLVGYRVAGNVNTPSGIVLPREDFNFQLAAEYELGNGIGFDISYMAGPSAVKFRPNPHSNWNRLGDMSIRSLMVGMVYTHTAGFPQVRPFGAFRVGSLNYNSNTPEFSSQRSFALNLEGGVKVPLTPRLGIVTQISAFLPVRFSERNFMGPNSSTLDLTGSPGISMLFALNSGLYYNFW